MKSKNDHRGAGQNSLRSTNDVLDEAAKNSEAEVYPVGFGLRTLGEAGRDLLMDYQELSVFITGAAVRGASKTQLAIALARGVFGYDMGAGALAGGLLVYEGCTACACRFRWLPNLRRARGRRR